MSFSTTSINEDQTQQRSLESAQEFGRRVHISVDQNNQQNSTINEESNQESNQESNEVRIDLFWFQSNTV